ncbi:MAG: CYTH domain-containing protein [Bacteroidaceae bacterium]|nr:CYTH domain-containing protein [Bacteroidaceae bacterium]
MEIEHKFLVSSPFKHLATGVKHIVQGYLSDDPNRTVRIRVTDDKAFITIKGESTDDGLSRYEWEKQIDIDEATQLLNLCLPGTIDKHRYIVPWKGHEWEVDEFHGALEGLTLAELEVPTADTDFELPPFVGEEVTGNPRYYNSQLRKENCSTPGRAANP